ncbi:MAG TPA: hypothetical protein VH092_28770, partial [Urbifossiella sp.]|nr:hypothetical protein [Urbifossiella sp.]
EWLGWAIPHTERTTHFYGWAPQPFTRGFLTRFRLKPEEFIGVHDRLLEQCPALDISFELSGKSDTGFQSLPAVGRLKGAEFHYAK